MKKAVKLLCFALVFSIGQSCTSTGGAAQKSSSVDYSAYSNLADILRSQPGVVVDGQGNDVTVHIRGISSITLETQPLFVVNDVPLGNSYASANNAIIPANITSIRILRNTHELTTYGELGTNGVIKIKTR